MDTNIVISELLYNGETITLSPDGMIKPTGDVNINENGTHNVAEFENAIVDVISGEYDIAVTNKEDGSQRLDIVDKDGSGAAKYRNLYDGVATRRISGNITVDVDYLGAYAFSSCKSITGAYLPNVTETDINIFYSCRALTVFDAPKLTKLSAHSIAYCTVLSKLNLPSVITIHSNAAQGCTNALTTVDLPVCTYLGASSFQDCKKLDTVILRADTVCQLYNTNCFTNTKIASGTGFIYVNDNQYDAYLTATNWLSYASQIKKISELPKEDE